jgi:hypothetical protein
MVRIDRIFLVDVSLKELVVSGALEVFEPVNSSQHLFSSFCFGINTRTCLATGSSHR